MNLWMCRRRETVTKPDLAAVDSALTRPPDLLACGKPDAAALASTYAFGLCGNHGFFGGNKRTAYAIVETFLDLNGYAMNAPDKAVVSMMTAVASGAMAEEQLAKWFRSFTVKREESDEG